MKYDIYFHNDFDGRASAAVMLAFLRSYGDDIAHFVPVDHHLGEQWAKQDFFKTHTLFRGKRYPAIVVDFPYHPKAAWWFDHHPTTFKKLSWEKNFKPDKHHRLEPRYPSCCHLVYDALKNGFGWKPAPHFAELVHWLDIIDGGDYNSARQTIIIKEPALQIDTFIESGQNTKKAAWLVELLSRQSLSPIAQMPVIKRFTQSFLRKTKKNIAFYRKKLKVYGSTSFIDLTKNPNAFLRYAPYYLLPKVRYNIRFLVEDKRYSIKAGANPWLSGKNKIHLGKFFQKYGGGGHKNAAGFNTSSKEIASRVLEETIAILRNA